MADPVTELLTVWSPATIIGAVVAGFGVGYWMVGKVAADPTWTSPSVSARGIGLLVILLSLAAGLLFFVGQAAATYAEGDTNWPRVVSRSGIWCVYAVFLGIGTWRRVADHIAARKAAARIRAERELGK